jgi:hypothetical protein
MLNALITQFARNIFGKINTQILRHSSKLVTHANASDTESRSLLKLGEPQISINSKRSMQIISENLMFQTQITRFVMFSCSVITAQCGHRTYCSEITGAIETARCVYEKYFLRFGFIPNFISDRAQSFLGSFTQELLKLCQVKSIQTSSFHPQMNSRCEIFNKTLGHSLRTYLLKGQTDWPNRLQAVAFGFNVSQVPTLGVSAYNLLYGCQPRLPIDLQLLEAARRSNIPHFVETFFR